MPLTNIFNISFYNSKNKNIKISIYKKKSVDKFLDFAEDKRTDKK